MDFAEAGFVIGEIAEAEGGGDEIEGAVREGQAEGVGFEERQRIRVWLRRIAAQC